jgi:hypothetical protein
LLTREPEPQLDDAADESVTIEFRERMFMNPWDTPGWQQSSTHRNPRCRIWCEK